MTDTKTKPDGWVRPNWMEELKTLSQVRVKEHPVGQLTSPICLVPPDLLDWCEEVEKFFQDELKWGMIEDPESVKKLLDKLKEVRK